MYDIHYWLELKSKFWILILAHAALGALKAIYKPWNYFFQIDGDADHYLFIFASMVRDMCRMFILR